MSITLNGETFRTRAEMRARLTELQNQDASKAGTPTPAPTKKLVPFSQIHVNTREYEMSHGKSPRGRGGWAFYIGNDSDPANIFWAKAANGTSSMLYREAVKLAKAEASARGAYEIKVGS